MQYRAFARVAGMVVMATLVSASAPMPRPPHRMATRVTVYKDQNCGCCKSWIEHLRRHGFEVVAHDTPDVTEAKRTGNVPEKLYSCHTAFVGAYVVEGHVPAADIQRLLRDKPKVAGLAVPGMPSGSPGMENGRKDPYDVIAFTRDGRTSVFARH